MIAPDRTELLVRAVALYLPVALAIGLAVRRPLDRRRVAAALLATAWNVPALLAVNLLAVRAGWWSFAVHGGTTAGIPADLWIGWALLWGAVPVLATTTRLPAAAAALVAADLVLMPLAEPAVVLGGSWLVGEAVAVALALVPGLAARPLDRRPPAARRPGRAPGRGVHRPAVLRPPGAGLRGHGRGLGPAARPSPLAPRGRRGGAGARRRRLRCRPCASSRRPGGRRSRSIRPPDS